MLASMLPHLTGVEEDRRTGRGRTSLPFLVLATLRLEKARGDGLPILGSSAALESASAVGFGRLRGCDGSPSGTGQCRGVSRGACDARLAKGPWFHTVPGIGRPLRMR